MEGVPTYLIKHCLPPAPPQLLTPCLSTLHLVNQHSHAIKWSHGLPQGKPFGLDRSMFRQMHLIMYPPLVSGTAVLLKLKLYLQLLQIHIYRPLIYQKSKKNMKLVSSDKVVQALPNFTIILCYSSWITWSWIINISTTRALHITSPRRYQISWDLSRDISHL